MRLSMGIDVGSTTAKVVIMNERVLFSAYQRHNAEILHTLQAMLRHALEELGNVPVDLRVTGSAGLGLSERFALPFIQEVVASAEVLRQRYPQVRTLIDIGGEDAKVIFLDANGGTDIRMNGACAGGTGAFIDQMATLLNVPVSQLNDLAEGHTAIHPIASRCGVFAKTDVQNLLSREVPLADIAASIFQAVVLQTLATLARGRSASPKILFSGGPLTFMPLLGRLFRQALGVEQADVVQIEGAVLLPAMGAALAATEANGSGQQVPLAQLLERFATQPQADNVGQTRLAPLFQDEQAFTQWQKNRAKCQIPRAPLSQVDGRPCFLGVDSGSTTTKVVLVDEQARIVFDHYANNRGNALRAVREALQELKRLLDQYSVAPNVVRSIVTGYGEDLIRSAFGFDEGMVETLAHLRAAKALDPEVSFILDIGGQDMKAIFMQNGHIQNIDINEACSSGCGSFIEAFAQSMGYTVADFARLACTSQEPCDLGSRCTVFMNSRVKQSLREGASVADISAGLAYSVVMNAIHKVLKITETSVLGEHILVQGGTFHNPAVHKAMEHLVGKPLLSPDIAALMGAYGAALTARDSYRPTEPSPPLDLQRLGMVGDYRKRTIRCRGCENKCTVTKLIFPNGNAFYSGNRCERVFSNSGRKTRTGLNLLEQKYELLFERPTRPASPPRLTLGIPRVLNMYENYPFWNALLVGCGFQVRLSDPSEPVLYQKGVASIMSENICFPAKLTHGHIYNLAEAGVDRIFYPMVLFERCEFDDAVNTYNCPIVTGYPDVIGSAVDPRGKLGVPLDQPAITFQCQDRLKETCWQYLSNLGVEKRTFRRAFERAVQAQTEFKQTLQDRGAAILAAAATERRQVVLLMGRPYHIDPMIHHGVPEVLANFDIDVITEDAIPLPEGTVLENRHVITQWAYPNRFLHAARWAGRQPHVQVVQLNSFGCGPDAIVVDEVRAILSEQAKRHTVVRIDEIESIGSVKLRLRSLIESLERDRQPAKASAIPRKTTRLFNKADRVKTILAPQLSRFYTAPLVRPLLEMGYDVEILPPPDRQSVQIGLKYTNNEICYPAIILIGDLIKVLQSGKYDPARVAVALTQTGGQCRATSYISLLKRALVAAGYENVPAVSVSTAFRPLNEQPGFKFDLVRYVTQATPGIVYSDALSQMYHATAVRELHRGQALQVADKYLAPLVNGQLSLDKASVLKALEDAVADFNRIPADDCSYPKVGVVGEIYVKYNAFGNNDVVHWLMDQDIEVVVPPILGFFSSWRINARDNVRLRVKKRDLIWFLSYIGDKIMDGLSGAAGRVLTKFRHYRPSHSIYDIATSARDIVRLIAHQYGEGWAIAGEIGQFVKHNVQNVLCLQPFGCIANHVIAKGVACKLKEWYPQLNLLFLDSDAGLSEVNYLNRLHFFVNRVRQPGPSAVLTP